MFEPLFEKLNALFRKPEPPVSAISPLFQALKRISDPVETYTSSMLGGLNIIQPDIPFTYLDSIEALTLVNPDMSQATANIVQLGNTGHFIEIVSKGKRTAKSSVEILRDAAKRIYPLSAGVDGLVNVLLGQLARTGALSAEIVPAKRLADGIQEVVMVPANSIRWSRNKDGTLSPYQYVSGTYLSLKAKDYGYIKLNPETYTYFAADSVEGNPYGIPPFASVLSVIGIQNNMLLNIASVVKKVGLVGFLSVLVNAPPLKKGESQSTYESRLQTYLNNVSASVTKDFSTGIFVGLKNQHVFDHKDIGGDFRGVPELFQVIEEQVITACHQDPAMFGRTYSTTETYAGVVFDKLLHSLEGYQRLVRRFLERVYTYELKSHGIIVDDVNVRFKSAKPLKDKEEQEARSLKIENVLKELRAGLISWPEAARALGYDTPFKSEFQDALKELQPKPGDPAKPGEPKPEDDEDAPEKEDNVIASLDRYRSQFKGRSLAVMNSRNMDYSITEVR